MLTARYHVGARQVADSRALTDRPTVFYLSSPTNNPRFLITINERLQVIFFCLDSISDRNPTLTLGGSKFGIKLGMLSLFA